jgi:hypothetical protein
MYRTFREGVNCIALDYIYSNESFQLLVVLCVSVSALGSSPYLLSVWLHVKRSGRVGSLHI